MAGKLHRLTTKGVQGLNEAGRYADGGNLYLQVASGGSKSWVFIYRFGSRQREMGLGSATAGSVTLAEAREKAAEARKKLAAGIDRLEARKAAESTKRTKGITFGDFADEYVKSQRPGWKNEKHADQWAMTLGDSYCKQLRSKPISTIEVDDVLKTLEPVWQTVPETARRLRMRIERVLDAAKVRGLRTGDNPARWRGHLDHLLPKHAMSTKGHHAAIAFCDMPHFMNRLVQMDSISARALEFTVLTAVRTSEVLGATWNEIDLKKAVWTIPAARMKAGREYRLPLSKAAIAVLARMSGKNASWVFLGLHYDKPLSNMAMLMLMRGLGYTETVHGFRSTFTDWASECTDFPTEVIKMAKAHAIEDKTEAAYRRGDLFEKRQILMEKWAHYVMSDQDENVVPFTTGLTSENR